MKPTLAVLISFGTLLAATSGCSRGYRFQGIIVDGDGIPVGGASIYLFRHDWEQQSFGRAHAISQDDGTFLAGTNDGPGIKFFKIVISKPGYREQQQLVEADAKNLRIVLERLPGAADAASETEP